jgi:hypothetical protein
MSAMRKLTGHNAGVGIAACPRSRHSFKGFVRTGDKIVSPEVV